MADTCRYLAIVGEHRVCRHCADHRLTIHPGACDACVIRTWPCAAPKDLPTPEGLEAARAMPPLRPLAAGLGDRVAIWIKRHLGISGCAGCRKRQAWINKLERSLTQLLNRLFPVQ